MRIRVEVGVRLTRRMLRTIRNSGMASPLHNQFIIHHYLCSSVTVATGEDGEVDMAIAMSMSESANM